MKIEVNEERYEVTVEFTRRNLQAMLDKLDDPNSACTLTKQSDDLTSPWVVIMRGVEDNEHYANRPAGAVYMPTTGEWR